VKLALTPFLTTEVTLILSPILTLALTLEVTVVEKISSLKTR